MKTFKLLLMVAIGIAVLMKCSKDGNSQASFDGTGLSGSTARFTITGDHLYTVDNSNLQIFSLATGSKPSKVGLFYLGLDIETITARDNSLFIGSQSAVYLVDVSSPTSPSLLGEVSHIRSCDPVVPDGNFAFVTLSTNNTCSRGVNRLEVLNIANLQNPTVVKTYPMNNPRGLAVSGQWLFVCDDGVKMFDKTNVNNLVQKDYKIGVPANDVIADDDVLIVTADDGIYQYSYANGNLQFLSKILRSL